MAISTDKIKKKNKDPNPEPANKLMPMKPFGKKGLKSPTYKKRNHGSK